MFARSLFKRNLLHLSVAFAAPAALTHPVFASVPADPPVTSSSDPSEIIVTATRREQPLSHVTASASAFTAAQMDRLGVKSVAELSRYTPGVTYDYLTKDVSIRGVGSTAGAGTTGIYIDDTPVQMRALDFNPNNTLPAVFDLNRVEILRGPQGTLFGAGSEGGAIRYITNQPNLDKLSALAHGELAVTQDGAPSYEAGAAIGGPIKADALAFRLSGWHRSDGGWIDQVNSTTGAVVNRNANATYTDVFRLALTSVPTARLTLTPALLYQNRDQRFYDQYWIALSNPGAGDYRNGDPGHMADHDRFLLPSLAIRYDFDGMQLNANSAYFERHESVNGYNGTLYDLSYFQQLLDPSRPGGPVDPAFNGCAACRSDLFPLLTPSGINLPGAPGFNVDAKILNEQFNYTQEIRLHTTNTDARISWLIGAFFADQKEHSTDRAVDPDLAGIAPFLFGESVSDIWGQDLPPSSIEYSNDTVSHDRQLALFADTTLKLTQRLKLNAGLRYAWTHFDFSNHANGLFNFGASGGSGSENEYPLTPKVGLSYQADNDNLFYASASQGYRSGGANAPFPQTICQADLDAMQVNSTPASYRSDTVTNYEAGARNRLLNGRLTSAISVFHADWNRIQQSNYLPSCGFQYTANLGQAISDGFDIDTNVNLTHAFTATLRLGYTDARYSKTTRTGPAGTAPILSVKGDSLGVARWTAALGGQYDFTVADRPAFLRADYAYSSGDPRTISARDPQSTNYDPYLTAQPETGYLSTRAGETLAACRIDLFVDNVFNARPQLNVNHEDQFTELLEATSFRPRTAGMSVTYSY
jgi:iron complex outermembrane recepter protein